VLRATGMADVHIDGLIGPPYASCRFRAWGAISLKDIVNPQVHGALQRLEIAIGRLETAATAGAERHESALRNSTDLHAAFEQLTQDHAALKESAERVALRLDDVIGRVQAVAGD